MKNMIFGIAIPIIKAIAIFAVVAIALLYFTQDNIIYHPHAYDHPFEPTGGRKIVRLDYVTGSGNQTAFYLPPKDGGPANRLWIMFGGNGALILDYADTLPMQPLLANEGFLMIDYPGYGYNQGTPSITTVLETANGAVAALSAALGIDEKTLLSRSGVFGHSLGTGVALEFAAAHPEISRIVLAAPFTSFYHMAYRLVGPLAHVLLHYNYDNEAILRRLAVRNPRSHVAIFHGDRDQVLSVGMGRTLARENPWITYREMPGLEHNLLVRNAAPTMATVMAGMP